MLSRPTLVHSVEQSLRDQIAEASQSIQKLREEVHHLTTTSEALRHTHAGSLTARRELTKNISSVRGENLNGKKDLEKLKLDISSYADVLEQSEVDYDALLKVHKSWLGDYTELAEDYDSLLSLYNNCRGKTSLEGLGSVDSGPTRSLRFFQDSDQSDRGHSEGAPATKDDTSPQIDGVKVTAKDKPHSTSGSPDTVDGFAAYSPPTAKPKRRNSDTQDGFTRLPPPDSPVLSDSDNQDSFYFGSKPVLTEPTSISALSGLLSDSHEPRKNPHDESLHTDEGPEDDALSIQSVDTTPMTLEQEHEILLSFTQAICSRLPSDQEVISLIPGFSALVSKRVKAFCENLKEELPRSVDSKPKRKVMKAISRLRHGIATKIERTLASRNDIEQLSKKPPTLIENIEGIQHESNNEKVLRWLGWDGQPDEVLRWLGRDEQPALDQGSDPGYFPYISWGFSASNGSASDPESLDIHERVDRSVIHDYITSRESFRRLAFQIESLLRHCRADVPERLHHDLLKSIASLGDQGAGSDASDIRFLVEWDIMAAVARRQELGIEPDIMSWLTVTGNSHAAQLETVGGYVDQTWPSHSKVLLSDLQHAVLSFPGKKLFTCSCDTKPLSY